MHDYPRNPTFDSLSERRVSALAQFGFTQRQREFLVTVMVHAGCFLERQYCAFTGTVRGQNSREFVARLVARGFARAIVPGPVRRGRLSRVTGDRYAGQTFASQFTKQEITYVVAEHTTSELYEALEPRLNSAQVVLLDAPVLEQQLLGLVWKGGKITHQSGEHDDFATAAAGVVEQVLGRLPLDPAFVKTCLEAGSEPGLMPTIPALFSLPEARCPRRTSRAVSSSK